MRILFALLLCLPTQAANIKFTGFKFTNKVGVSGTFKKVDWSMAQSANLEAKLLGTKVTIDSYSIDAGNEARNINITEALFQVWGDRYIRGEVVKVDKAMKKAHIKISVGDKSKVVPFKYSGDYRNYQLTAKLDLIDMGLNSAFASLAKRCATLHTGDDGVAKTWSEVDVVITP